VDWIYLGQDRDKRRAVVSTEKFRAPYVRGISGLAEDFISKLVS
jgi:hypothetical protein